MGNYEFCFNINGASKKFTIDNMNEVDAIIFSEITGFEWDALKDVWNGESEISFEQLFQIVKEKIGMEHLYLVDEESLYENSDLKLDPAKKRREDLIQALNKIGIYDTDKYNLLYILANSPRYKDLKVSNIFNEIVSGEEEIDGKTVTYQSETKAMTIVTEYVDENGEWKKIVIPTFAGTGDKLISWIEDARLKVTEQGIQAQRDALDYVVKRLEEYPDYDLGVCGYSKGGNIAAYVGVILQLKYPERLEKIINMDGPGFDKDFLQKNPEFAQTYEMLLKEGILEFYTPKDSFVGMMMFPEEYDSYVHYMDCDTNFVVDGHTYTTWKLDCKDQWRSSNWQPSFETASGLSETAKILRKIVQSIVNLPDDEFLSILTLLEDIVDKTSVKTLGDLGNIEKLKEVFSYYNNASWIQKANLTKLIGTILEPKTTAEFICSLAKEKANIDLDEIKPQIEEILGIIAQIEEEDAVTMLDSLFRLLEGNLIDHISEGNMLEIIKDIVDWYTKLEWKELNCFRELKNDLKDYIFENEKKGIQILLENVFKSNISSNGKVSMLCICSAMKIPTDLISAGIEIYGSIQDYFQSIVNQITKSIDKFMKLVGSSNIDVTTKDGILQFLSEVCMPGLIPFILSEILPAIKALFSMQTMVVECDTQGMNICKEYLNIAYERAKRLNERLDEFYAMLKMTQIEEYGGKMEYFSKENRLVRSNVHLKNIERIKECADRIETFMTKLEQWDLDMVKSLNDF